jgi:two-component system, cell cycle response regulator
MSDAGHIRLLLVEDEATQRLILRRRLTQAGYLVETADNGQEALERILASEIQMLITDWEMPGMDGVTLCRRAREAPLAGYLYILLLTSHGSTADIVAGLDAGADDYLRKPADEAELLARLKAGRRIIELERSLREAQTQLRQMATTDPLLGVFNRRYLLSELPKEVERARRYERPLSVVMADLDHFKRINDVHGHAEGDAVLVSFAETARSCLRRTDWIARTGGEEFLVVLPETSAKEALLVAEKIRSACESIAIGLPSATITVTASFGVASLTDALETPHAVAQLLRQADAALYRSKHAGRNRVTGAEQAAAELQTAAGHLVRSRLA